MSLKLICSSILSFAMVTVGILHATDPIANQELQLVVDSDGFNGSPIECLGVSNDGRWLAAASNKVVRIWDLKKGRQLPALRGYQEPYGFDVGTINALTFSPDSRFLLVGVTDNTEAGSTRIYDLSQGGNFHALLEGHLGCTRGIAFSPSGKYVATWGCDGQIIVSEWDSQGRASKAFSTDWSQVTALSPQEVSQLGSALQSKQEAFKLSDEGNMAMAATKLQRAVTDMERVLGTNHDQVLGYMRVLAGMHEKLENPQRAKQIHDTVDKRKDLVPGGCFCFADEEYLVFSHCGATKIVSASEQRILFHDEFPAFISQASAAKSKWMAKEGETSEGTTMVDLHAFKTGKGPWFADGRKEYRNGVYQFSVRAFDRQMPNPVIHEHLYDPVTVTFNAMAGLGASSDRLGSIHIWSLKDGKPVGRNLEPNALRLWNVAWDDDSLYFADTSHEQKNFNFNHRGPISKKLDLRQMAIVDADETLEPIVRVETRANGTTLKLQHAVNSQPKTELFVFSNGQRWPAFLTEPPKRGDTRPLRTLPQLSDAWSYCFVQYPECDGRPHLLVGTDTGAVVEYAINRRNQGRPELEIVRKFIGHTGAVSQIAIASDSRRFATSSLDGTLRVWILNKPRQLADLDCLTDGSRIDTSNDPNLNSGDVLQRFGPYTYFERIKPILKGEFAPGQQVDIQLTRRVFDRSQNEDATGTRTQHNVQAKLLRAPDLVEPVLNMFLADDGEWIAWNAQGFYNASPNGAKHLGFHRNRARHLPAEFYTSEQYRDFYRPNLVMDTFQSPQLPVAAPALFAVTSLRTDVAKSKSILAERDFEEVVPPVVKIKQPLESASVQAAECRVEVEVGVPSQRRIREVSVQFNQMSVPARRLPNSERSSDGVQYATYIATPELEPGSYTISAVARHDIAKSQASEVNIKVVGAQRQPSTKANLFVLSIGVSEYRDSALKLKGAATEANDVASLFQAQAGGQFENVQCQLLVDNQCTREGIYKGLQWLRKNATTNGDLAVLFINAHVLPDNENSWYLAPYEADPAELRISAIQTREMLELVERIPRAVLLMDVFHKPIEQTTFGQNPFQESNKAVVLACSQSTISEPGIFGSAIADVLKSNVRKQLKFDSFFQQVRNQVLRRTSSEQAPISVVHDKSHNGYVLLD